MADLIGIQILGLTPAPSLADNTYFPVQRTGIDKAEKVSLQNLSSYLVNSTLFSTFIDTSVASKVAQHTSASDPHGDRAFASTLLQNHLTGNDPHGDRAYSDNTLTTAIQTHISANDPHGDRAYTSTSIQAHSSAIDPHGDRAYTDGKVIDNLTASKAYTDSEINLKVTTQKGVTLAPLVTGKVPSQYIPESIIFNARGSFPTTGVSTILYTDTTGNDIYRWNGTTYINLTPEVDIPNLNLSTDNVSEGINENRKYLTTTLKTSYDDKVSNVKNIQTLEPYNNLVIEKTTDKEVTIKNIKSDSSIILADDGFSIAITDNVYNYSGVSETEEIFLDNTDEAKLDIAESLNPELIYNIVGETSCISYSVSGDSKYINKNEKIKIEALIGLWGEVEDVPVPTDIVINSQGTVVTGKAVANKQVKIYNKSFVEISSANVLADTNFTANLPSAIIDGSPIYIYTIDDTSRSAEVKFFTPNKEVIREVSLLSVSSTGLELKGVTEKNSTVVVKKLDNTEIGTGTSNVDGFFTITLTEAVVEEQEVNITTTNEYAIQDINNYLVELAPLVPPSEIKLNNERTFIQGKAEPNSTITLLNNITVITSLTVNSSGVFSGNVTIDKSLGSLIVAIEKDVLEYDTEFVLLDYIDETNKPLPNAKVISSEFKIIDKTITNVTSKANYILDLAVESNKLLITVNNTEHSPTKWDAKLKITTTGL